MFTDWLDKVHTLADAAGDPTGTSATTVALIGSASLVACALISGYFGTRSSRDGGRRHDVEDCERRLREAEWGEAHAENERHDADVEARRWRARYEVLCIALWRRRLDPNKFTTGEETDDDARF